MIVFILVVINYALETFDTFPIWDYINVLVRISEVVLIILKLISYFCNKMIKHTILLISIFINPQRGWIK